MVSATEPTRFPGYEIRGLVHETARNRVVRATRDDGQPVLLKVLRSAHPSPAEVAWLRREHDLLARLQGSGVARGLGLVQDGDRWALVLEDPGGATVAERIAAGDAPMSERLHIAQAAVTALEQLHGQTLIHKNLRPQTMLWDAEAGRVWLVDLGQASVLPKFSALHDPGDLGDSFHYVSPEQTGRVNRAVDHRADFYTLGVVLYELMTGVKPFGGDDAMQVLHGHIALRPTTPAEHGGVPQAVSDVVMRLLAKAPEDRYQSSFGLLSDLQRCLAAVRAGEPVEPFALGQQDLSERFHVPQKLYGRDDEVGVLLSAFEQAATPRADQAAGLLLVTGYAGIGKTALAREVYGPIHERGGYFISGKFDQLQRGTPYSEIIHAFRGLIRRLLRESEQSLAGWREELEQALGDNGRVITDLIPELSLIVGEQPPLAQLNPAESRNRFNRVFHRFVRVFPTPAHPLVIFLDDLQWADAASLELLELLLDESDDPCLFIIGAYRDHEVGPGHPLQSTLKALQDAEVPIHRIHLGPLGHEAIAELVADTVGRPAAEVEDLARLVELKTAGNPLFVIQLLESLVEDELLLLDRERGCWRWDTERIQARGLADDVVDLVLGKIRRLPDQTQALLTLAACLGSKFGLTPLAAIAALPVTEAWQRMLPAITEGFVVTASSLEIADPEQPDSGFVVQNLEFSHDRIQQAAYSLIPEDERAARHLAIGRTLRDQGLARSGAGVFTVVDQLNRGREGIDPGAERLELARLDLEAGQRAQGSLAYAAAQSYLDHGLACLTNAAWDDAYELAFELHRAKFDVALLIGEYEAAEAQGRALIERARTPIEKAGLYPTLVSQFTFRTKYEQALVAAEEGLALLDVDFPLALSDEELGARTGAELEQARTLLGDRAVASLLDEPEMTDPQARTATSLLLKILPSVFFAKPALYPFVVFKAVAISLRHGPSSLSADLFSNFGQIIAGGHGEYRRGYEFGQLAMELTRRFNRLDGVARSAHHLASFIGCWSHHLRQSAAIIDTGFRAGVEGGDLLYSGYLVIFRPYHAFYEGRPLDDVAGRVAEPLAFNRKTKNQLSVDIIEAVAMACDNLRGQTTSAAAFEFAGEDEATITARWAANNSVMAQCFWAILQAELRYLYDDPAGALEACERAEPILALILGNVATAHHALYHALSLAALHHQAPPELQAERLATLDGLAGRFETWAASCPENFAHLHAMVTGEIARVKGQWALAADRFEVAIAGARTQGFVQHAALACELAGKLWLARGSERVAAAYLTEAVQGQRTRGAVRKVEALRARYRALLRSSTQTELRAVASAPHDPGSQLDLSSVLKASQTIASELVLERLLTRLMHILMENAGARRGALVFVKDGELVVQADASITEEGASATIDGALRQVPLHEYAGADEEIVRYVARTQETVILSDATREGDFTGTPYAKARAPKAVLCAPLQSNERLLAIIYLENDLTVGAFTPGRLEMLRVLSSQIAISIENALLYREIEDRVTQRTAELAQRNEELQTAMENLRRAQNELVQSEKLASMGRLSLGIAHELKNPLNFVINFADLDKELLDEIGELVEAPEVDRAEVKEVLGEMAGNGERILEHGRRANSIVQRMMEQARRGEDERADTELGELLRRCSKQVLLKARDHTTPVTIDLQAEIDDTLGPINVFPQSLETVLSSVIDNGVDAILARYDRGAEGYAPQLHTRLFREGERVVIEVQDNGTGIPADVKDRIFEPFFTTKPPGKGTGLGLSLAYDIIDKAHHGRIAADTTVGQGTTFRIELPG